MNRKSSILWVVLSVIAGLACFAEGALAQSAPESSLPAGWDSDIKLKEAKDLNPDPAIVEIDLEARVEKVHIGPGEDVEAWTYDGGLPGPLIRVRQGSRLIVHFKNNLPEPTTVHWHGLRVPIDMDGVPGISQPEILPGEIFTYSFVVPDAGLFWYHPHVQSAKQVGFGLYGALLVEDPKDPVGVADQLVMVLSDIDITPQGKLESPDTGGSAGMAFGREGTIMLVNGKREPMIQSRSGATQRWLIVNTAKSRYFKLDLGEGNNFVRIGGDGGLMEYSTTDEMLVITPGERADVLVQPKAKRGTQTSVIGQLENRGYGSTEFRFIETLFKIAMADVPDQPLRPLPKVTRVIEPLSAKGATPVQLELAIKQDPRDGSFEYQINGAPFWKAEPLHAALGETQLWTLNNTTPWSHPFHLHGYFFQVVDKNAEPVHPIQWKDTVNVPFKDSIQILVRFDDRPGTWMVHCHILDHAEGGLMTTVQVGDGPAAEHTHKP